MLLPQNQKISFTGDEVLDIFREIELILTSLHCMGSHYPQGGAEYERETTRFIDEWKVCARLARVRGILGEKFDSTLGSDDMDDLERAVQDLPYWESMSSIAPE